MDSSRFEALTRYFGRRYSRRRLAAGGLALVPTARTHAATQEGTPPATPAVDPGDPHPSADSARPDPEFLFVQPFAGGTWAPKAGEEGTYTLTLSGAAANTVYFSDRPERIFGLSPTQRFLDSLGFSPENPPNAALVARRDGGEEQEVLVIELFNPAYDAATATLTYDARVLADYGEHGLAHAARQQADYELGETFAEGGLFIDDCSDIAIPCMTDAGHFVGSTRAPSCWDPNADGGAGACVVCHADQACADAFPDDCRAPYHSSDGSFVGYILICSLP